MQHVWGNENVSQCCISRRSGGGRVRGHPHLARDHWFLSLCAAFPPLIAEVAEPHLREIGGSGMQGRPLLEKNRGNCERMKSYLNRS